jgi:hypothetical protein
MALKLRRGTDAERQLITPEAGEPLWIDNEALWIGDGSTVGGIKVTGGIENDLATVSIDALSDVDTTSVAPTSGDALLWNGSNFAPGVPALTINDLSNVDVVSNPPSNGDSLVWDGAAWVPGSPIFSPGEVINGYLDGDMQGSVFGENSSVMVDAINRELFAEKITSFGGITATGSVSASDIRIGGETPNQISLFNPDDTSLIITTANTGGNVIISRNLRLGGTSAGFPDTSLNIFNDSPLSVPVAVNHSSDGTNTVSISITKSRGTKGAPTAVQSGDNLGAFQVRGYNGSANYGAGGVVVIANGAPEANRIPGRVSLFTFASNGAAEPQFTVDETRTSTFSGMAQLAVYADTSARDAAATPAAGMVCFVTDGDGAGNPQFQGYTGSAWVALN